MGTFEAKDMVGGAAKVQEQQLNVEIEVTIFPGLAYLI